MARLPSRAVPPSVTITFDNGPSPATAAVLDVLASRDVRATFFVVGTQLERPGGRALAERARSEGHWIGNHSMTHAVPLGDDPDPDAPAREIDEAQALLGELAHPDRLFRPFGGGGRLGPHLLSAAAVEHLEHGGYTVALWNSVPRDWERPDTWVDVAMADIDANDHTVLVVHDLPTGAMDALPDLLDRLDERGVEVVQELADECVPIKRGRVVQALDGLVTTTPTSRGACGAARTPRSPPRPSRR